MMLASQVASRQNERLTHSLGYLTYTTKPWLINVYIGLSSTLIYITHCLSPYQLANKWYFQLEQKYYSDLVFWWNDHTNKFFKIFKDEKSCWLWLHHDLLCYHHMALSELKWVAHWIRVFVSFRSSHMIFSSLLLSYIYISTFNL